MKKLKDEQFRKIIEERNIEHLVHFTNVKNIESIILNGLIPVKYQTKNGIHSFKNDVVRNDKLPEMTSFSVEFPNYQMLNKLRLNKNEEEWAIIFLKSDIILARECIFCYDNASKEEIRQIPYEYKMTIEMFSKMFEDIDGYPLRKITKLKRYFTTSPQAEIMIKGDIDSKYIEKIVFFNSQSKDAYSRFIPNIIKVEIVPDYFYAREDSNYIKEYKR